jgi:hypothetical protein
MKTRGSARRTSCRGSGDHRQNSSGLNCADAGHDRPMLELLIVVDLRRSPHGGACRSEQCALGLPLQGSGPAPRRCGSPIFRPSANRVADVPTADQTKTSRLTVRVVPICESATRSSLTRSMIAVGPARGIRIACSTHTVNRPHAYILRRGPAVAPSHACAVATVILGYTRANKCASDRGAPIDEQALTRPRQSVGQRS